jgi:endonuclease III
MSAEASPAQTSRYFGTTAGVAGSMTPARLTRASLARFAYTDNSPNGKLDAGLVNGTETNDVPYAANPSDSPVNGATSLTRKRKRTTTVVKTNGSPSSPIVKTEVEEVITSELPSPSKARRLRKPAKLIKGEDGSTAIAPPTDWEEMYNLTLQMRLHGVAANAVVDTMGCERLATDSASARDRRFHTLTALMLSSQTKDTVTGETIDKLKAELPGFEEGVQPGLNLENMLAVEPDVLNRLIGKVGFHNNKTKYLKQTAVILRDQFGGDIPGTIEGMMSLPGVGPKMAYLCMGAKDGWDRVEGIGVDVHVHRITNLWGWHTTKTPEETRLALQSWLPREKWREINWLLVGFGQKICLPVGRKCGQCELGLKGLCKSAERKKVIEGRKYRESLTVKKEEGQDGEEIVKVEKVDVEELMKDVIINEEVPDLEDVVGQVKEESPRRKPRRSVR